MENCSDTNNNDIYIVELSSLISLISTLISIPIYFILPNIKKNKALRLICCLLVSNAISSIGRFGSIAFDASIIRISSMWVIYMLGACYAFGFISGINFTLIFSINLYFEVYHKKSLDEFEKLMIVNSFGIAGIVAALATLAFTLENLIFYSITFLYIISIMTITIGLYIKVVLALTKISHPEAIQCMKDLAIYPLISIVMMILFSSEQILVLVQKCYSTYYLIFIGIRGFQGFIDVVIYGFNSTVRTEIYNKFHKKQNVTISIPIINHTSS